MNQVTPVTLKVPITIGHVKIQIYVDILCNIWITYSMAIILLSMADIKACFCFGEIHADLTQAFGFIANYLYNLGTAIVFALTTSASSWEAFWQAIVFAKRKDLVVEHKKYLDMFKWEETDPHMMITCAYPWDLNWGIINKNGTRLDLPACIYVDDALMLATDSDLSSSLGCRFCTRLLGSWKHVSRSQYVLIKKLWEIKVWFLYLKESSK